MSLDISNYSYLWDGSSPHWALLHVNAKNPKEEPRYLVVNTESRQGKIIEDESVCNAVVEKMLEAKVRVVTVGNGF